MSKITGYYGCSCHPFETWEECEKEHKKHVPNNTIVINRCFGWKGVVIEQHEQKGFIIVKYGKHRSDEHLEHVAQVNLTSEHTNSKELTQLQLL
jgi:hypothetical protein